MLNKINESQFDKVYTIMEQSFPEDEIRPYDEQRELFKNPRYSIYAYSKEELCAFIAVWEFDEFLFVEHFAVDERFRNQGLGGEMLSQIHKMNKSVCLEVEPPDTDISKRRIEFYMRNGFFLNEYDYFQPPISKGRNIVPLMIMTSKKRATKEEFENIKDTLYKEVYKYER